MMSFEQQTLLSKLALSTFRCACRSESLCLGSVPLLWKAGPGIPTIMLGKPQKGVRPGLENSGEE